MLNTVPVVTTDFRWELGFNVAINRNKVLSMPDPRGRQGETSTASLPATTQCICMPNKARLSASSTLIWPQYVTDTNSPDYGKPIVDSAGSARAR